jgi:hypothetical protein
MAAFYPLRSARAKDASRRFRTWTRGDCFSEVLTNCVWRARVGGCAEHFNPTRDENVGVMV